MLIARNLSRFFHTTTSCLASEKSALAALRKKTGYTFSNCKKALEIHNNDLAKAEEWLKQQAKALGWSKATKLEGRQTTQGLVGVNVENNEGVLVEVNCETDFVARNAEFENIVKEVAETCLNYLKSSPNSTHAITKIGLDSEQLKSLKASDGNTLADKIALMIGSVGENATLKRAVGIRVNNGTHLSGYAHPSGKSANSTLLGRIGGLVALRSVNDESPHIEQIGAGLCQHIVGMAPTSIGKADEEPTANNEDETNLIHQEYLLDDTLTVKQLLDENQVEVVDFQRFECGERSVNAVGEQPLDKVEVCQ
ncbi:elongation factor Ts, mitochondrial [Dendroctonus ponderosae]